MTGRVLRKFIIFTAAIGGYFYLNGKDAAGEKRYVSLVRKYTGQEVSLPE